MLCVTIQFLLIYWDSENVLSTAVKYMARWAEHRRENGKIHAGEYLWHALPLWQLARFHICDNSKRMITSHFIYFTFYGRYQKCTFIIPVIDFAKLSGNWMSWTFLCKFLCSNFAQKIYLKVHLAEHYVISQKTTLEFLQIDRAPSIYICICKKYYLHEKTIIFVHTDWNFGIYWNQLNTNLHNSSVIPICARLYSSQDFY